MEISLVVPKIQEAHAKLNGEEFFTAEVKVEACVTGPVSDSCRFTTRTLHV